MKIDLYAEFGLEPCATANDIKKAYRRLALAVHPDKVKSDDRQEATDKFQQLSLYYGILSDPQKRKRYDDTGSIQEAQELFEKDDDVSWTDFFKQMYDSINGEKIQKFKENYQYGSDEIKDVLVAYDTCKGDMFKIIEHVPCAELGDIERFQGIIQEGIDKGTVAEYPKFRKVGKAQLSRKLKRAEKEAMEAEKLKEELDQEAKGMDALKALIQAKQKDRIDNLVSSLEEKYTRKSKKSEKKETGSPRAISDLKGAKRRSFDASQEENDQMLHLSHHASLAVNKENIDPISLIRTPAEALNTKTGHLEKLEYKSINSTRRSKPTLVFENIKGLHCNAEEALPRGTFVPQFRIRVTDSAALKGLKFKISCVRSSLDLLLWATREDENDPTLIKILSELTISDDTWSISGDQLILINLEPFYLETPTTVYIEIVNILEKDQRVGLEIDQVLFTPQESPKESSQSPVKVLHKRRSANTSPSSSSSYICAFEGCHRTFCRLQNLKSHEKIHLPNRNRDFVCHVCQAGFTRSQDLTRHINIHSGSKNFQCPGKGCEKRFSRKDALRRHIRSVKCCDLDSL